MRESLSPLEPDAMKPQGTDSSAEQRIKPETASQFIDGLGQDIYNSWLTGRTSWNDEWAGRFSNFPSYASSAIEDVCDVVLYEEYHLTNVRYTYTDAKNYDSSRRRWHVYLDGNELAIPITENPMHELSITPLEPGEYVVTADQWVMGKQTAGVEYTVQKTLTEKSTGRILYQVVKQGKSNDGLLMFRLDEDPGGWEATGEYIRFKVNSLGNIVDDDYDPKVQRVH